MAPPDDPEVPAAVQPRAMQSLAPDTGCALHDMPELSPKYCGSPKYGGSPKYKSSASCEEEEEVLGLLGAIRREQKEHKRKLDNMLDQLEGCMGCPGPMQHSRHETAAAPSTVRRSRRGSGPDVSLPVAAQGTHQSYAMARMSTMQSWGDILDQGQGSAMVQKLRSLREDRTGTRHEIAKMRKLGEVSEADDKLNGDTVWTASKLMRGATSVLMNREDAETWHGLFFRILTHPMFDAAVGVVILINALTIGVELTIAPTKDSATPEAELVFTVLENVFIVIYLAELSLRLVVCGRSCLRSSWVIFDIILVVIGVVGSWLIPLVIMIAGDAMAGIDPPMFLRMFRLARLARTLRLFMQFQTLWMLVSGLGQSVTTIMNVFIVLTLTLFMFACFGVEVITHNSRSSEGGQFEDLVDQYWGTLPMIMLTLVQFVTLDSVGQIYGPMIKDDFFLVFFFLPFLLVVSVILMNLVTAVVIEVFLDHTKKDQDMRRMYNEAAVKRLIPDLRDLFGRLDVDGRGNITPEELELAPEDLKTELELLLDVDSLVDLFEALDVDRTKSIDLEEFLDGMKKVVCSNKTLEMTRILKMLRVISDGVQECCREVHAVSSLAAHPAASPEAPVHEALSTKSGAGAGSGTRLRVPA